MANIKLFQRKISMRIDQLIPETPVTLDFYYRGKYSFTEEVTFVGRNGKGTDRVAVFRSIGPDNKPYTWEAYRFEGRWVYGTSADRLSLAGVKK